jgi:hypothetical protein
MGLITWLAGMRPTAAQMQSIDNETINRCTSSTRPADALTVEGMRIWEIDTRRMMVRVPISGIAGTGDGAGGKWVCEPGQTVICANLAGRPIASECPVGLEIYQVDTKEHLRWDGTAFVDWIPYAPSFLGAVGFGVGNGLVSGRYRRSGSDIEFEATLKAGSTTQWGPDGSLQATLPVTSTDDVTAMISARFATATGTYSVDAAAQIHPVVPTSCLVFGATGPGYASYSNLPLASITQTGWLHIRGSYKA